MDAIDVITRDHDNIRKLFGKYNDCGPRAYKTKQRTVDRIVRDLVAHAEMEEQIFYPEVRRAIPDLADDLDEDLEEHHVAEVLLTEIHGMDSGDERFDAKVKVLEEIITHHLEEEEQDLLPKVRKAMSADRRKGLGERMLDAKRAAPTRPHPWSPDTPPGNVIAGIASGLADRARDGISRD